jgi:hypothetical protein
MAGFCHGRRALEAARLRAQARAAALFHCARPFGRCRGPLRRQTRLAVVLGIYDKLVDSVLTQSSVS